MPEKEDGATNTFHAARFIYALSSLGMPGFGSRNLDGRDLLSGKNLTRPTVLTRASSYCWTDHWGAADICKDQVKQSCRMHMLAPTRMLAYLSSTDPGTFCNLHLVPWKWLSVSI